MGVGRVWRVLWGTNSENVLDFNWPTVGDDPTFWRQPREGSEVLKMNNQQSSWITGRDFFGMLKARWFGMPQFAGSLGLQGFFDWAQDSNTWTLVPDAVNAPLFQIPGCFLVEPFMDPSYALEPDGTQSVGLKFWNPSIDLGLAFRSLMFEYRPGTDLTNMNGAFTRASTATYISNLFGVSQAASNVIRDRSYPLATLASRVLTMEPTKTNSILQSQAPATTWTTSNLTPTNNIAVAPDGTTTAGNLVPNTTVNLHTLVQNVTISGGEFLAGQFWVKPNGYAAVRGHISDGPGSNFMDVTVDLNTLATSTFTAGSGVVAGAKAVAIATGPLAGWVWVGWWGKIGGAITAANMQTWVFDTKAHADAATSFAGDGTSGLLWWGAQFERNGATINHPPTSYIATTTVPVTRGGTDQVSWPFPFTPQGTFFYLKYIETGARFNPSGNAFAIEVAVNGATPRTMIDVGGGAITYHHQNGFSTVNSQNAAVNATYGDTVEALGMLYPDGSVQIATSKNGAADVLGTRSAALALQASWGTNATIDCNNFGGGTTVPQGIQLIRVGPLVNSNGQTVNTLALARAA